MPYKEYITEKVYWTVGEVAEDFNLATSNLRFWEDEFDWIKPKKGKKGNRQYTRKDIKELAKVNYLANEVGMTLAGIRLLHEINYFEATLLHFKALINEQRRLF